MGDLAVRLIVVAIAALVVAIAIRRALRSDPSVRGVDTVDLAAAGQVTSRVVFFSSSSCGTCDDARAVVSAVYPRFQERSWEADADALTAAGIDEVPLTVVVGRRGRPVAVFRGTPPAAPLRLRLVWARLV
jgi:hypothetical protein